MHQLIDAKLLSRVRALIRAEHAGFVADGCRCVEPGCSCWGEWHEGDPDPVSGPFRNPPARCSSFEQAVLPLDPDLEAAYRDHLQTGSSLQVRRCAWRGCRREVASGGPAAKWCAVHAEVHRRQQTREAVRKHREHHRDVSKLASEPRARRGF
jgi:hypothetical protein